MRSRKEQTSFNNNKNTDLVTPFTHDNSVENNELTNNIMSPRKGLCKESPWWQWLEIIQRALQLDIWDFIDKMLWGYGEIDSVEKWKDQIIQRPDFGEFHEANEPQSPCGFEQRRWQI